MGGRFSLYGETWPPNIRPDANAQLVVFGGGNAEPLTFEEVLDNPCEGAKSLRAVANHHATNAFSGWSYQWGLTDSLDMVTFDMNRFHAGSLRLCFNAQADLQGKVRLGIRSGNVPAGTELSFVVLTNLAYFDGSWHEITVPIKALAGSKPWADLTRVKNFFTVTVVGETGGPQPFYIDNLRWEPEPRLAFSLAGRRLNGDFYFALTGPLGSGFVLERTSDFITWERLLTNFIGTATFEFTETNSQSSSSLFYRAESR